MLITVTPVSVEPVTLAEAKLHLREDSDAKDSLIEAAITAAREIVERQTARALAPADYVWASSAGVVAPVTRIPFGPISAVTEVSYADADGVRQVVPQASYAADLDRSTIRLTPAESWSALSVKFSVAPSYVPGALKAAILLLVGDLITNTEAGTEKPLVENPAVQNLMMPFRLVLP